MLNGVADSDEAVPDMACAPAAASGEIDRVVPSPDWVPARGRRRSAVWRDEVPVEHTETPETMADATARLHMDHRTFTWLRDEGVLTLVMGGPNGRSRCVEESGWDRCRIWHAFMDRPENRTPADFHALERVARVANWLSVPADYEYPDEFSDAVLAVLERERLPLNFREFAAVVRAAEIRPGESLLPSMFSRAIARSGRPCRHLGKHMPTATVAEFRTALSAIDGMEGTLLAEPDEVLGKLIDPALRGAVVRIPDPLIRNMVGLYLAVRRRSITRHHAVAMVRYAHMAAEILEGTDKKDAVLLDKRLRDYAFGRKELWADSAYTRYYVGAAWLIMSNIWAAHRATFRDERKRIKAAMPAFPHLVSHLGQSLKVRQRRLKEATEKRRKLRTDEIADTRDMTEAALEARTAQVERHWQEFETRRARMRADSSVDEIRYDFEEDVVPVDGLPDGSRQVVLYRAVRARRFFRDLLPGAHPYDRRSVRQYIDAKGPKAQLDPDEILLVFEAVRPAAGSEGAAVEPTFVTLHARGVLCAPGLLNADKRIERAELIRRWRLPSLFAPVSDLLVQPIGTRSVAATWGLRQNVTVLHIDEFRHAGRFGRLAGRIGLRTGARSGETRQLAWQVSGFGFARVNGEVRIGFRAIAKMSDARRLFLLDDLTFIAATQLAELSRERWEWTLLPEVCLPNIRKAGPVQGHLLFQTPSGPMPVRDLNTFYRLVMAGMPPGYLHDLRHVFANAASQDGVELEDISDLLSHESRDLAAYYAGATARQRARHEVRLGDQADDRVALL